MRQLTALLSLFRYRMPADEKLHGRRSIVEDEAQGRYPQITERRTRCTLLPRLLK